MSFLTELKRRNVIRMAGLYLVGAWLLVQIGETLLPIFHTPEWVLQALVVLLALGLLPTLVFSWLYELTPDGLKRDAEVAPGTSSTRVTGRRMDRLLLAGMLAVVGIVVADRFWPRDNGVAAARPNASGTTQDSDPDTALPDPLASAAAKPDMVAAPVASVPGIAVLPFTNMSPDPDNAFFAGGVHEEVLTKLARIAELKIISRTSMERIATEQLEISAIGKRLGVSHVLEGSVRRARDQVRVTVQLIEAATDAHIWAESYDRKLDDVFAIQSEIALAIADQLKITLSPRMQATLSERPTQNQAAYELYLRALEERHTWRGAAGFRAIIDLLEPAVRLDPEFLAAQVILADAYGRMNWLDVDADGSYRDKARLLVAEIVKRWPQRAESELAQAMLSYTIDRDYERALQALQALQPRLPNDTRVLTYIASSLKRLGRYDEFVTAALAAHALNPESAVATSELLRALRVNQRFDEALAFGERARLKFPDDEIIGEGVAFLKLVVNQDIDAMLEYGLREAAGSDFDNPTPVAIARYIRGDIDGALELVERHAVGGQLLVAVGEAQRAEWLQLSGRKEQGQALARSAYQQVPASIKFGEAAPNERPAFWFAQAAAIAAQAGARDAAISWEARARTFALTLRDDQHYVAQMLAASQRRLGNHEAAWAYVAPFAGDGMYLPDGELRAFKGYYDQLYGKSPSYREYMAMIASAPRPCGPQGNPC